MSKFDESDAIDIAIDMVKSEWKKACKIKEAITPGNEKEYVAASAVEQAMWDLWGEMLKALEAAVLSQFPS